MELLQHHRMDPVTGQYYPAPVSSRSGALNRALAVPAMNASELMYFFGAPLAHVVDYENHLRASRCEKTFREMTRGRRALGFPEPLTASPPRTVNAGGRP